MFFEKTLCLQQNHIEGGWNSFALSELIRVVYHTYCAKVVNFFMKLQTMWIPAVVWNWVTNRLVRLENKSVDAQSYLLNHIVGRLCANILCGWKFSDQPVGKWWMECGTQTQLLAYAHQTTNPPTHAMPCNFVLYNITSFHISPCHDI